MILLDYRCESCGTVREHLQPRPAPDVVDCACGGAAERQMPTPLIGMARVSATRGESQEPPPGALDTRPIAEGKMSADEWRRNRREERRKVELMHDKRSGFESEVGRVLRLGQHKPI